MKSWINSLVFLGDIVTIALVTIVGFASHDELGSAGSRMLTTFIPLLIAWILIAPHLKVFEIDMIRDWKQLWRPFWAMVLAAPFAAWLRGAWLGTPILPIFVFILGGVSAIALLLWRSIYWWIYQQKSGLDG